MGIADLLIFVNALQHRGRSMACHRVHTRNIQTSRTTSPVAHMGRASPALNRISRPISPIITDQIQIALNSHRIRTHMGHHPMGHNLLMAHLSRHLPMAHSPLMDLSLPMAHNPRMGRLRTAHSRDMIVMAATPILYSDLLLRSRAPFDSSPTSTEGSRPNQE